MTIDLESAPGATFAATGIGECDDMPFIPVIVNFAPENFTVRFSGAFGAFAETRGSFPGPLRLNQPVAQSFLIPDGP